MPSAVVATSETRISRPFQVAPPPFVAAYRSPSAGAFASPSTYSPSTLRASRFAQIWMPAA